MLFLQWAYDPGRYNAEVEALAAGPVKEMPLHRSSFGGVPQLFVDLDEPSPVVRALSWDDGSCLSFRQLARRAPHLGGAQLKAVKVSGPVSRGAP
jgi:hypothetical protein